MEIRKDKNRGSNRWVSKNVNNDNGVNQGT